MPDPNSSSTERDPRPFLTVERVAARLDVHQNTVKRLIHMRELKAYRVGRQLRVDPKDLDAFLQERVIEQKQQQPGDQDRGKSPEGAILSPDFTWE
jgi:excisionase family DNA binding protein